MMGPIFICIHLPMLSVYENIPHVSLDIDIIIVYHAPNHPGEDEPRIVTHTAGNAVT